MDEMYCLGIQYLNIESTSHVFILKTTSSEIVRGALHSTSFFVAVHEVYKSIHVVEKYIPHKNMSRMQTSIELKFF